MNQTMLAAVLDGQVVVLDSKNARLLLMDTLTERVWRSCNGLTHEEIAARLGHGTADVLSTLRELESGGMVACDQDRWTRVGVAWV